jgi:hypothetical protein
MWTSTCRSAPRKARRDHGPDRNWHHRLVRRARAARAALDGVDVTLSELINWHRAVIAALRSEKRKLTPVELAELLGRLTGRRVSDRSIVFYFARAFPEIPLAVLRESALWTRVDDRGDLSDEGFNELLHPWLGRPS